MGPISHVPIYHPRLAVGVATNFCFEAHAEGITSPWKMQKQRVMSAMAAMIVRNFHTVQYDVTQSQSRSMQQHNSNSHNNYVEFTQRPPKSCNTLWQQPQWLCRIFTWRPPNSPHNTLWQWPQWLCRIFTWWSHQNSHNTHNSNSCNDYVEFSHSEHPKILAGKISLKSLFSKENLES